MWYNEHHTERVARRARSATRQERVDGPRQTRGATVYHQFDTSGHPDSESDLFQDPGNIPIAAVFSGERNKHLASPRATKAMAQTIGAVLSSGLGPLKVDMFFTIYHMHAACGRRTRSATHVPLGNQNRNIALCMHACKSTRSNTRAYTAVTHVCGAIQVCMGSSEEAPLSWPRSRRHEWQSRPPPRLRGGCRTRSTCVRTRRRIRERTRCSSRDSGSSPARRQTAGCT